MRHAFIILSYNELALLKRLVCRLTEAPCDIYLNIDGKLALSGEDLEFFKKKASIRYIGTDKIHWGGRSVLSLEMKLLSIAINDGRTDYFHLVSGQDYPVKPVAHFLQYFENKELASYIDCRQATHKEVCDRLLCFTPYDWFDARSSRGKKIMDFLKKYQGKLHLERSLASAPKHLMLGSQWCSLTKAACCFILEFTRRHPQFYRRLNHTFAPEELYFPTILVNYFKEEKVICRNNLRFIRWSMENGNSPANLAKEHFKFLADGHLYFARKMTSEFSPQLIELVDHYLIDNFEEYGRYFAYDGKMTGEIVAFFRDLEVSSVLVVGDSMLYVDAFLGSGFLVNGLVESDLALEMARLFGISDYCQKVVFSEPMEMEEEDRFDVLLLVNRFDKEGRSEFLRILKNLMGLTCKYILLVETEGTDLSDMPSMLRDTSFYTDAVLNKLLNQKIKKQTGSSSVCLLIKQ